MKGSGKRTMEAVEPEDRVEKEIWERAENEEAAISAIKRRRAYLKENRAYLAGIGRMQFRAKFAPRNEKETATMRVLYDDDE